MKHISTSEFNTIVKESSEDVMFIDVRTPAEFSSMSIKRVQNIPLDTLHHHIEALKKYKQVYVHCQSGNRSKKACEVLMFHGFTNLVNVQDGIQGWVDAGFPVLKKKGVLPLMQQVLLTAGLLILLFTSIGFLAEPFFHWFAFAVGLGLSYSGLSGNCMMAKILARMPWNTAR